MTTHKEALTRIAAYPFSRAEELSVEQMREIAREALAQPELCKYGQEPKSCTSSPMDCQCALDATFAQQEQCTYPNCDYPCMNLPDCKESEQEPVAWREFVERVAKQKPEKPDYWSSCGQCERNISDAEDLLVATPPYVPTELQRTCVNATTWRGLTDDEIEEMFNKSAGYGRDDFRSFARAIEAAHGIKGEA